MACGRRQRVGHCGHFQCPYPEETDHGYECVEIFGDCCEAGLDCYDGCEYSYTMDDKDRIDRSDEAVRRRYPEEYPEGGETAEFLGTSSLSS